MKYIFDENLLKKVNEFPLPAPYSNSESMWKDFIVRPLSIDDYNKGILEVLKDLTEVGQVSEEQYIEYFKKMKDASNSYYIIVIENITDHQIIACGSLILQYGFIHECSTRGCIEDISVREDYQGKQLGKVLLNTLVVLGRIVGCYRLTLHCVSKLTDFYNKFGFSIKGNNMDIRF